MELPVIIYTEPAKRYGITPPETGGMVKGLRFGDGKDREPGYLYLDSAWPAAFLNEAMEMTEKYGRWVSAMDAALENGGSPQELLDLSESILGEPVFLVDPSMKRIAATMNTGSTDVFFSEIVEKGYPTLSTYERLDRGHFYDPRYYTGRIMHLITNDEPSKHVALRGIRLEGKLAATALMIFQNSGWSEEKTALFSLLTERLSKSLEHPWVQADTRSEQYDFLLRDLLEGKKLTEEEISSRLRFTQRTDPCPCHAVVFAANEASAAKLGYVCRILNSVFPGARPLVYDGRVFTLLPARAAKREDALDRLEKFCAGADCVCGVSAPMSSLVGTAEAYGQAADTLALGLKLSGEDTWFSLNPHEGRARAFCHDDLAMYRTIQAFSAVHDPHSLIRQEFQRIRQFDAENGTDNLRVLYHFLCSHMNYTEAARRLYMHRNSVFYRIERICDLIGVEGIDDALERGLVFSYMAEDMLRLPDT